MSRDIPPGVIVNVTIRGVRYVGHPSDRLNKIADEHGDTYPLPPQAKIERVAPAHWPPRVGDVWGGYGDVVWFARRHDEAPGVLLMDARDLEPETGSITPEEFLENNGAVPKLLFRPDTEVSW